MGPILPSSYPILMTSYDVKVVDAQGNVPMILRGYQTMSLPDPIQADLLDPIQAAFQVEPKK